MKKVYVIVTSNDGNIGAFTTVKKCFEVFNRLIEDGYKPDAKYTYNQFLKAVRNHGYFPCQGTDSIHVDTFELNKE